MAAALEEQSPVERADIQVALGLPVCHQQRQLCARGAWHLDHTCCFPTTLQMLFPKNCTE